MSYFPDRRVNIDPAGIADALSESNPNAYGAWSAGYGNNVTLDTHPAVGNYAISADGYLGPAEMADLLFTLQTPINLSSFEKFQFMLAAIVGANNNLVGTGKIVLKCAASEYSTAEAPFTFTKGTPDSPPAYYTRTFVKSNFVIYDEYGAWDWASVNRIWFMFDTQNVNPYTWDGYQIWIDGGPFFLLSSTPSRLAVYAEDINGGSIVGKNGTFVGPSGGTTQEKIPFGPAIVNSGVWSVTPTDPDFVRWKDGATERTKLITVPSGGLGSATAVFESGESGTPAPPPNILPVIGAGIGLAMLLYLITR